MQLIRAFLFLEQFKLNICYNLGKKYIILDTLNCLKNANTYLVIAFYLELDILFIYNTILIKIYLTLVLKILARYNTDVW